MTIHPDLSIVTTFRNEEAVLPLFLSRISAVLCKLPLSWEIIFIDDASTDNSLSFLNQQAARETRYKIIRTSRRFGVQACLWTGLEHAGGAAVITIDMDLQDPPELIPELINQWREGAEIVHTVRKNRLGEPWMKKKITRLGYHMINLCSKIPFPVEAGDFKLFSRQALNELLTFKNNRPYLRGLAVSLRCRQSSLPYIRQERAAGKSHFPLFSRGPLLTFLAGITAFPIYSSRQFMILSLSFLFLFILTFLVPLKSSALSTGILFCFAKIFFSALSLACLGLGFCVNQFRPKPFNSPLCVIKRKINIQ